MDENRTPDEIEILKTLGETVRRLRKAKPLSIDELGDQCGLSPNYIGSIELGRRDISYSTLQALAHAFGVAPRDVLSPPPHISQRAADAVRLFEASTPAMRAASMTLFAALGPAAKQEAAEEESAAHGKRIAGFGIETNAVNWQASAPKNAPKSREEFGWLVRRLRKQQGLTIEALAERSKLSTNYLATVERGHRDPGILTICAIAKGLGMSGRDLLGGSAETVSYESIAFANLFDGARKSVQDALVMLLLAHLGKPPEGGE